MQWLCNHSLYLRPWSNIPEHHIYIFTTNRYQHIDKTKQIAHPGKIVSRLSIAFYPFDRFVRHKGSIYATHLSWTGWSITNILDVRALIIRLVRPSRFRCCLTGFIVINWLLPIVNSDRVQMHTLFVHRYKQQFCHRFIDVNERAMRYEIFRTRFCLPL